MEDVRILRDIEQYYSTQIVSHTLTLPHIGPTDCQPHAGRNAGERCRAHLISLRLLSFPDFSRSNWDVPMYKCTGSSGALLAK